MAENKNWQFELEEYIKQGEPSKAYKGYAWQTAIGLQAVDGIKTSEYLMQTAVKNIEGEITLDEADKLLNTYYKENQAHIADDRTEEADKVSARIAAILSEKAFSFTPQEYISVHYRLFNGIYKFAGKIRDYNITKREWVLNGETVYYASHETISETLEYDMRVEREFSYANMPIDEAIRHLVRFCANLWQIHPFCEGNTRTTAVFMIKYLRTLGFNVVNDVFAKNSWYFRNSLVRANYTNLQKGITETTVFLERFFRSMLLGEEYIFRNRELHIEWESIPDQSATEEFQSAKSALNLPSKCKNCTLEEMAILRIVQANPRVTQKEMASEIGKSERTLKTITVSLQEKGLLRRVGGKKNGRWEIIDFQGF